MAKPGDVILTTRTGWSKVIAHVDEDGKPTGGYLIPRGNEELIKDLVTFIKKE